MAGYMLPLKELKLSDDQMKAIETISSEHRKFRIKKEADIQLARIDLGEILRKGNDFNAARTKVKEISAMQLDMKLAAIELREKIFNTLTKEQQEKLPKIKAAQRERWMEKRHKEDNDKK